jgi:hypothetical protein
MQTEIKTFYYINMNRKNPILNKNEIDWLGASLRAIAPKLLKQCDEKGKLRLWFQGGEPYFDIFFELTDEEITWFQFTLRGQSLSWHQQKPVLQTGHTNEFNLDDINFYAASKMIENDTNSDAKFIELVKSILRTRANEEIFAKALALFN